jgi:hypothetical protein
VLRLGSHERFVANEVRDMLLDAELPAKVRAAVTRKIPRIVVVGRWEAEQRTVTVRCRCGREVPMPLDGFVVHATDLVWAKSLDCAGHVRCEAGATARTRDRDQGVPGCRRMVFVKRLWCRAAGCGGGLVVGGCGGCGGVLRWGRSRAGG